MRTDIETYVHIKYTYDDCMLSHTTVEPSTCNAARVQVSTAYKYYIGCHKKPEIYRSINYNATIKRRRRR